MLQGRESWLFSLVAKLLDPKANSRTERPWLDLLDSTSSTMLDELYHHKFQTPLYAKVDMYHYQMAAPLWEIVSTYLSSMFSLNREHQEERVVWWNRTFEEVLLPPVALDMERQRLVRVDL